MEYASRIHIRVKDPSVWKKLYDVDIEPYGFCVPAEEVFNINSTDFVIDSEWSTTTEELEDFVAEISDAIEEDGVVIADNTCLSVDPYTFVVTYFGDCVDSIFYTIPPEGFSDEHKMWELFEKANINDIESYIKYGKGLDLIDEDKDYIRKFGISV